MKVVVLAGGTSTERDISIISGKGVAEALSGLGYEVFFLDAFFGCSDAAAAKAFTGKQDLEKEARSMKANTKAVPEELSRRAAFFGPNVIPLCKQADRVFLALHGCPGEDGKVQAAFDLLGIRYTGTGSLSSALAMDKGLTKLMFDRYKVPTPEGVVLSRKDKGKSLKDMGLCLPVIVKPCCGGSSVGVAFVYEEEQLGLALDGAFALEETVLVEKLIKGREFTCAVIDGEAYPVVEIIPDGVYDYENKYNGKTKEICPAQLPVEKTEEMKGIALQAVKALGITGYSRMDFMMDEKGGLYCLEANTLPGMTPTSLIPREAAAKGIGYPELCRLLLEL